MMLKRSVWTVAAAFMGLAAWSAGPMGHVVIAGKTMDGIRNGSIRAPQELVEVLKHSDARRYFSGGAVGPDVAESASHYGQTADLARTMLQNARGAMRAAADAKDLEALAKARNECLELGFRDVFGKRKLVKVRGRLDETRSLLCVFPWLALRQEVKYGRGVAAFDYEQPFNGLF